MRTWLCVLVALSVVWCASCGQESSGPTTGGGGGTLKAADPKAAILKSVDNAVAFLRSKANKDGGWGEKGSDVGITGLVLEGLARAPSGVRDKNNDLIEKGVAYLLTQKRADGSIVNDDGQVANYRTSIAVRALIAIDKEKYKHVIDAAVKYTKGIQDKTGAIGYGTTKVGDIINTSEALEMMRQAGLSEKDEVFQRAMEFVLQTQNLDEYAPPGVRTANDGGAIYRANRGIDDASKAGTIKLPDGTEVPRSYGGATYNLLKDMLFAGMAKDSPRVQAAYKWIADHYTVKQHPEMPENQKYQGLYYLYYTMARTLELWGSPTIQAGGTDRNWAQELSAQIISLQKDDGSWVNPTDRWWEGDPTLVTAYTISSLGICHRMLEGVH